METLENPTNFPLTRRKPLDTNFGNLSATPEKSGIIFVNGLYPYNVVYIPTVLFSYFHVILGLGLPLLLHINVPSSPLRTTDILIGSMYGFTEKNKKIQNKLGKIKKINYSFL